MIRSLEHAYFAEKNTERRKALREELDDIAKTAAVAEKLGTDDEALAKRIRQLGFEGDSVRVFDLLPLILMSWADGTVQQQERNLILAALEQRGVSPDSDTCALIETLLERPPTEAYRKEALEVLKALRDTRGGGGNIVELSQMLAQVAGGIFGVATVSKEERALLQEIADKLGGDAQAKFQQQLG